MCLLNYNVTKRNEDFVVFKTLFWIYYQNNLRNLNGRYHFFCNRTLSSNMANISEHINFPNQKIHKYDQMRKMIVNLGIYE